MSFAVLPLSYCVSTTLRFETATWNPRSSPACDFSKADDGVQDEQHAIIHCTHPHTVSLQEMWVPTLRNSISFFMNWLFFMGRLAVARFDWRPFLVNLVNNQNQTAGFMKSCRMKIYIKPPWIKTYFIIPCLMFLDPLVVHVLLLTHESMYKIRLPHSWYLQCDSPCFLCDQDSQMIPPL